MNRQQLQRPAGERVQDAEALLAAGRWSGAYYLAGYAVECGLKACVAKLTVQYDSPNKEIAAKSYTHNLESLVVTAKLESQRRAEVIANAAFASHCSDVIAWNERSRYLIWSEAEARILVSAVTDSNSGMSSWITVHW